MSFRIIIAAEARRQLLAVDDWWTTNRPEASDLIVREFGGALTLLAATPTAGKVYTKRRSLVFRRLLLGRSGFHAYYLVDETARIVVIVAVWNGVRGHGPQLA